MRAVVQKVSESSVVVENRTVGKIGNGLMVLLGIAKSDSKKDADYLADKIANLRIFEDENNKLNLSLIDTGGQMLVVSQFTLLGDCRKGRRPSFINAARPEQGEKLYERFVQQVKEKGVHVETGQFRTMMKVHLVNDGPVTLIVESK